MELCERIKAVRKSLGLTQREFGSAIGVSDAAVAHLESGRNNPAPRTLELICTKFNVNPEWLKDGEDVPMFLQPGDDDAELVDHIMAGEDEFRKSVFRAFARMGDQEWQLLRKIVDEIKKADR